MPELKRLFRRSRSIPRESRDVNAGLSTRETPSSPQEPPILSQSRTYHDTQVASRVAAITQSPETSPGALSSNIFADNELPGISSASCTSSSAPRTNVYEPKGGSRVPYQARSLVLNPEKGNLAYGEDVADANLQQHRKNALATMPRLHDLNDGPDTSGQGHFALNVRRVPDQSRLIDSTDKTAEGAAPVADQVRSSTMNSEQAPIAKKRNKYSSASYYYHPSRYRTTSKDDPQPLNLQTPYPTPSGAELDEWPARGNQNSRPVLEGNSPSHALESNEKGGGTRKNNDNNSTAYRVRDVGVDAIDTGFEQEQNRPLLVEGADTAPSLEGIVDLRHTEHAHEHRYVATPVIHETVRPIVHHVHQEAIQRDIHHHDIYHRVFPITEVQVLPTKHYMPAGANGELVEIPEREILDQTHARQVALVTEKVAQLESAQRQDASLNKQPPQDERMSSEEARRMETVVAPDVRSTEQTWVHPPTIAEDARLAGQSEPVYFASPTRGSVPADDQQRRGPNHEARAEAIVAASRAKDRVSHSVDRGSSSPSKNSGADKDVRK